MATEDDSSTAPRRVRVERRVIPVTAILLGYLALGESISLREILGALVIGSALLLIDGRVLSFTRALISMPKATR